MKPSQRNDRVRQIGLAAGLVLMVVLASCNIPFGGSLFPEAEESSKAQARAPSPQITPFGGVFVQDHLPTSAAITVPAGTTVYYTTDGTSPVTSSNRVTYSGTPITLPSSGSFLIRAYAAAAGYADSPVVDAPFALAHAGRIYTMAGTGVYGTSGDGGPARLAQFRSPSGVERGPDGHIYVSDAGAHTIRKIDINTGIITTVVGSGVAGFAGDGAAAGTATQLNSPQGLTFNGNDMYILDTGNNRIRKVALPPGTGLITTFAGTGSPTPVFPGSSSAAATTLDQFQPSSIYTDGVDLYFTDAFHQIAKINLSSGYQSRIAGGAASTPSGLSGDGLSVPNGSTPEQFADPRGVVYLSSTLYIADSANGRLRSISSGLLVSLAGSGTSFPQALDKPVALTPFSNGVLIGVSAGQVWNYDSTGPSLTSMVGTGVSAVPIDGADRGTSPIPSVSGLTTDGYNNIYIADNVGRRIYLAYHP